MSGNVDQQAILIKQLQEQHYYQYMHQLYQQQHCADSAASAETDNFEMTSGANNVSNTEATSENDEDSHDNHEHETSLTETKSSEVTIEASLSEMTLNDHDHEGDVNEPEEAQMWTRKDINEFKDAIKKEESEAIIKIGHGETVTVRVPTHADGKSLYWEFATDSYDIGFGLFFEWVEPEDTQVIYSLTRFFSLLSLI